LNIRGTFDHWIRVLDGYSRYIARWGNPREDEAAARRRGGAAAGAGGISRRRAADRWQRGLRETESVAAGDVAVMNRYMPGTFFPPFSYPGFGCAGWL